MAEVPSSSDACHRALRRIHQADSPHGPTVRKYARRTCYCNLALVYDIHNVCTRRMDGQSVGRNHNSCQRGNEHIHDVPRTLGMLHSGNGIHTAQRYIYKYVARNARIVDSLKIIVKR